MSLTASVTGPSPTSFIPSTTSSIYSIPTSLSSVNGSSIITSSPTVFTSTNNTIPTSTITTATSTTTPGSIFPGGEKFFNTQNPSKPSIQFGICAVAGLVFFITFCFLRVRLPVMFAPRKNMKRHKPPELSNSFFGWIIPVLKASTEEMLLNVGLDAVLMLHFLVMAMKIFGLCSIFGVIVLIPISATAKNNEKSMSDIEKISITHTEDGDLRLIAFLVFTYFVTIVTLYYLTQSYYNYVYLHAKYMLNQSKQMVSRSVIITGIPERLRSDQALAEYYENLGIGPVESCYVVRTVHQLDKLIKQRASALTKLEKAYAKYWGNPCRIPGYDPDIILDDVEMYKKVLDLAEKRNDNSSSSSDSEVEDENGNKQKKKPFALRLTKKNTWKRAVNTTFFKGLIDPLEQEKRSKRPTVRTGFLGLFGQKIDAIEYYTVLFDNLDKMVAEKRRSPHYEMTNVAFVTFEHMSSAVIASQIAIHPEPFACRTILAYEPRDVLWSSVAIRGRERIIREIIVWAITIALVIFWFVPVTILSSLLSLETLKRVIPKLAKAIEGNEALKGFVSSFVTTVALNIVTSVLPLIFDALGYYQGLRSRSAIAESTFSKYFFFLVFFTLITFTLANASMQTVIDFANNPTSIPERLADTLPNIAPFFINYVILQGFLLMPMNLLLLGALIVRGFYHAFICKTPRDHAENRAPWSFNYGTGYPVPLLVFIIVLEYSCISPIIMVFGAIYFCFTYVVYKYQFLYVYFRPYEAAGRLWIMTVPRIIFGLVLFQLTMTGYFVLRKFIALGATCAPLIAITILYKFILDRAFLKNARNLPMQLLRDNMQKLPDVVDPSDDDDDDDDDDDNYTQQQQLKEADHSKNKNNDTTGTNSTEKVDREKQMVRNKWKTAALSAVQLRVKPKEEEQTSPEASAVSIVRPRHRKVVLDEDDYEAVPDKLTDYRQPPMQLNPGLLDTGLKRYGNPWIVGILPQLWLPMKEPDKAHKEGKAQSKRKRASDAFNRRSEGGGTLAQHLAEVLRRMEMEVKRKEKKPDEKNEDDNKSSSGQDNQQRTKIAQETAQMTAASLAGHSPNNKTSALRTLFKMGALKKQGPKATADAQIDEVAMSPVEPQHQDPLEALEKGSPVRHDSSESKASAAKSVHATYYHHPERRRHHSENTAHATPSRPEAHHSGVSSPAAFHDESLTDDEHVEDHGEERLPTKRLSSVPLIDRSK
ncbi:DUF221-domain-containing protein [Rhizopus microsporus var. microsporus]|uniref:DUF221-domain-containing protein n=1 Tax=Rhizopus microsporus var. microsporus TaxID=86635 RepID=A0A1X0QUZ1_RHIZD|nr:DUF221-domain-containing protein [Rhizopus microsporus var. microsporus]